MANKIRVLIVDDDSMTRKALKIYVHRHGNLSVVADAADRVTALRAVTKFKPDIALVDILGFEGEMGGIQIIKEMKAQCNHVQILAISSYSASLYADAALKAGAAGYLLKQEAAEKLAEVIMDTMNGKKYVSGKSQIENSPAPVKV